MGKIRVGVAGWDYPDWNGVVYPARPGRDFDRLAFIARFVDAIEINSSFYRVLDPHQTDSWVRRTRGNLRFSAKTHRSWTHDREPCLADSVPETLRGLAPLRDADVLGALLVQFPQRFHRTPTALEHLERLGDQTEGWPVVVEVRHVSWDRDDAEQWFRDRGLGWCVVDQPRVGRSTAPARPRATSSVGYLRLHGRNTSDWFREDAGRDARYDYLYSLRELETLAAAAADLASRTEEVFVVQNNHFRGQALVNGLQMSHLVGGEARSAPPDLVRVYPQLEEVVTVDQGRLF